MLDDALRVRLDLTEEALGKDPQNAQLQALYQKLQHLKRLKSSSNGTSSSNCTEEAASSARASHRWPIGEEIEVRIAADACSTKHRQTAVWTTATVLATTADASLLTVRFADASTPNAEKTAVVRREDVRRKTMHLQSEKTQKAPTAAVLYDLQTATPKQPRAHSHTAAAKHKGSQKRDAKTPAATAAWDSFQKRLKKAAFNAPK